MKRNVWLSVLTSLTLIGAVFGNEYYDIIQKAEKAINLKYPKDSFANKRSMEDLNEIISDSSLSTDMKIAKIRDKFLKKPVKELNKDTATELLMYVKPLTWQIHSISLAHDVKSEQQIIFSTKDMVDETKTKTETETETESRTDTTKTNRSNNEEKESGKIDLDHGLGGVGLSLIKLAAKNIYQSFSKDCERKDIIKNKQNMWTKEHQRQLSKKSESICQTLRTNKLSGLHLSFSVTFQNNTNDDLFFSKGSTIPVYADTEHLLMATPHGNGDSTELRIPKHGCATILFRGNLDTTRALNLVNFMQHGEPDFRLTEGQFQFEKSDGTAIDITDEVTVKIKLAHFEWNVKKYYENEPITMRQMLWAINGMYNNPVPFVLNDNGLVGILTENIGFTAGKYKNFALLRIDGKIYDKIDNAILDKPVNREIEAIHIADSFKFLVSKNAPDDIQRFIFEKFKSIAENSPEDASINTIVGVCYDLGNGVTQNYAEAVKWYRKAADQGLAEAQCNLGVMYANGRGVAKDYAEAVKWYRKAADQGDKKAQMLLAEIARETIVLPRGIEMKMIKVEHGKFIMGKKDGENCKDEIEHEVTLTKDFYIGQTEVTQEQYEAVMGNNPSRFKNGGKYPVEGVTWYNAMEFCNKLNGMGKAPKGWKFTLPTEAQWEFAAKGGNKSEGYKYSGSSDCNAVAWYEDTKEVTQAVGGKKPNELGLYDMSGNVWEWCLDKCDWKDGVVSNAYGNYSCTDPCGSSGSERVNRGGGWYNSARKCRVAFRSYDSPDNSRNLGFRVVLVPVQQ